MVHLLHMLEILCMLRTTSMRAFYNGECAVPRLERNCALVSVLPFRRYQLRFWWQFCRLSFGRHFKPRFLADHRPTGSCTIFGNGRVGDVYASLCQMKSTTFLGALRRA